MRTWKDILSLISSSKTMIKKGKLGHLAKESIIEYPRLPEKKSGISRPK